MPATEPPRIVRSLGQIFSVVGNNVKSRHYVSEFQDREALLFQQTEKNMVRKVITRSPHREVGSVNAEWLLSHPVHHESHLERRFIMICLACPYVLDVEHQPETVELVGEKRTTYTPDFRVTLKDGEQKIVEVKPKKFVAKKQEKLKAAELLFAKKGLAYEVITDQEIDKNGLGMRAIHLHSFARAWIAPSQEDDCIQELTQTFGGSAQLKQLISKGYPSYVIWSLVGRHKLQIPAGINLTEAETVSINQTKENASDFFRTWFDLT